VWLVGGAVRDPLLGKPEPNDFDLVTDRDALELARLLHSKGVSSIAPVLYPRFGTALVRVEGSNVEIVTARKESYEAGSRKPDVEPASLLDDAKRRDFTVNALLKNLHSGELLDPLGCAVADLESRVLRTPLEPAATFRDDPLRMLRAVRFRWQLGFEPAEGLYEAIRAERERLRIISGERIREELVRMLGLPDAHRCLKDLMDLGLLEIFAPELCSMPGVEQGSYHHLDVWDHTLVVLREAGTGDLTLSLAALLHDVGKPQTRAVDDKGQIRFFGHESAGAEIAERILRRLKFPNELVLPVVRLVKNHMRLTGVPKFTDSAARRLLRDLGEDSGRLIDLIEADGKGLKRGVKTLDLNLVRERLEEVAREKPETGFDSPLTGDEIKEFLNLEEGPEVGRLKSLLAEKVLEGELSPEDKEGAKRALLELD